MQLVMQLSAINRTHNSKSSLRFTSRGQTLLPEPWTLDPGPWTLLASGWG